MRVLHVVNGLAWRFGGTAAMVLQMTQALQRGGNVQVEIATTDADGAGGHLAEETKPKTDVPVHYFHHDYSERWKVSLGLRSWLKEHVRDYDLLHVHGIWSFSTTAACRAARRARRPYVLVPHGMLSPYTFSRSPGVKKLYWHLVERRNVRRARCLHLTTEAERDEIAHLRLATPTCVVPPGLEPRAWEAPPRPDYLVGRLPAARGNRPVVLFLSRLHPKKGVVDVLLPAFVPLRESAYLVIAGGADDHAPEYVRRVETEVKALGLENDVALLGPVDSADRFSTLDSAAVFVLPSHHENFGIVVAEAMARRVPVVISKQVQAGEHVERADAGRVVALDAPAMTDAIRELLSDPAAGRAMGERGRNYVRENLDWNGIGTQVTDLYSDCVADPRQEPSEKQVS